MSAINSFVLSVCIIAVISAILETAVPESPLKKQYLSLVGLAAVTAVMLSFDRSGFTLDLSIEDGLTEEFYSDLYSRKYAQAIADGAAEEYEEYFLDKLNRNGVEASGARVSCSVDEENVITVEKVSVTLARESDEALARELIAEELPQMNISITREGEDEQVSREAHEQQQAGQADGGYRDSGDSSYPAVGADTG
ncbi:MAG: hypothetical protein IJ737_04360 [Ruminococcus sp.]|nr:hypothetical protein [Ruminococcus sp.]